MIAVTNETLAMATRAAILLIRALGWNGPALIPNEIPFVD
jgi:hypothetical protein